MKEVNDFSLDDFTKNGTCCLFFYVDYSIRCQDMVCFFDDVQINFSGIRLGKINLDENPESAVEFNIYSAPTTIFIRNGRAVKKIETYLDKNKLIEELNLLRKSK